MELTIVDEHRTGKILIQFNERLNKFDVISPRFYIQVIEMEHWTTNLLPSFFDSSFYQLQLVLQIMRRHKYAGRKVLGVFF